MEGVGGQQLTSVSTETIVKGVVGAGCVLPRHKCAPFSKDFLAGPPERSLCGVHTNGNFGELVKWVVGSKRDGVTLQILFNCPLLLSLLHS